ncbi:hypothetical protein HZC27_00375 [Candidatus Roizmanbacteria bacterium]|nr:hypothetical protein [Candidatus Roizmanbacteria bacterium]
MTHFTKVITIIIVIIIITVISKPVFAYTIGPVETTVSAYVEESPPVVPTPTIPAEGKPSVFSLFGYTCPTCTVSVQNPGLYRSTDANSETGKFEFASTFPNTLIEDICLVAQDKLNRVTMPVCIPPPPPDSKIAIGPVIMPPTVSINNNNFYTGDRIIVSGQTVPSTDIKLSLFTDESKTTLKALYQDKDISITEKLFLAYLMLKRNINPVRETYAATLPKRDIKVDKQGNFIMNLPFEDPQFYRTFAQTLFNRAFSQKSVTLNFDIFPGWFIIMKAFIGLLTALKGRLFEIILLIQVLLILYYVIRRFSRPHTIARMRSLALREHPALMMMEHALLLQEHELASSKSQITRYKQFPITKLQ